MTHMEDPPSLLRTFLALALWRSCLRCQGRHRCRWCGRLFLNHGTNETFLLSSVGNGWFQDTFSHGEVCQMVKTETNGRSATVSGLHNTRVNIVMFQAVRIYTPYEREERKNNSSRSERLVGQIGSSPSSSALYRTVVC